MTGSNAPYGSVTYSDMLGQNLGVVVSANYSRQYQDKDHSRIVYP